VTMPLKLPHQWDTGAREKLAIALLIAFLFGWVGVSLTVQIFQIHDQGYGSGITNRGHLPVQIRERYGVDEHTTPQQLMDETSR
jgi:hypothetical protein